MELIKSGARVYGGGHSRCSMKDLEHRTSNERTQPKELQLAKRVYSQILKSTYLSRCDFSLWVIYSGASKTSLFLYPNGKSHNV